MGPTTVYQAPRPREPNIGVGVRGSALQIGRDGPTGGGMGALLRFRSRPVELELEVGRDRYQDTDRDDTRLGASLYVPLVNGTFSPYLVAGTGVNFSYFGSTGDQLTQGFLAGGAGLSIRLSNRFVIAADARYMLRRFFDDQALVDAQPLPGSGSDGRDEAVEGRLGAMFYF